MDFKEDFDQSPHSIDSDDSNHDSDIEARLYAEIYFSNTIEGDDNSGNIVNNNDLSTGTRIDSNPKVIDNSKFFEKNMNQLTNIQNNNLNINNHNDSEKVSKDAEKNLDCSNTVQKPESSNVQRNVNSENLLQANQNKNITKNPIKAQKTNKRSLEDDNHLNQSVQSSSKKSKVVNKFDNNVNLEAQQKISNYVGKEPDNVNNVTNEACNTENIQTLQNNSNTVINPSNSQGFIQLLSPEFNYIFFGAKLNSKRLEDFAKLKSSSKSKVASKNNLENDSTNVISKNIDQVSKKRKDLKNKALKKIIDKIKKKKTTEKTTNIKVQKNKKNSENNAAQSIETEIIDISSESSNDSEINDSKYNRNIVTEKKIKQKDSEFINSKDSVSDSEESICEVPVPRKPTPPLIDLKDSDREHDSDSSLNNSLSNQENPIQNMGEAMLQDLINSANADCNSNHDNNTESENEIILNCTQVTENRFSSISEIKRLNQQSNTEKSVQETNIIEQNEIQDEILLNSCTVATLTTQNNDLLDSIITENVTINDKVTNPLHKKHKNKSHCCKQNMSIEEYFFQPMTNEMKSFYNNSWGGENFDVEKLQRKMSTDPKKWAVLDHDLHYNINQSKRYFGMVCAYCQKIGHKETKCPEKRKFPICHMCGVKGHFEHSCRQKQCLTCGKKQNMYRKTCENCKKMSCSRCLSKGHLENSCPDLWRRYHQTTSNLEVDISINSNKVMKPQHTLYCCNCARKGHDSTHCKKYRWSLHFLNPSYVSSYSGPNYIDLHKKTNDVQISSNNFHRMYYNVDNVDYTRDDFEALATNSNYPNFCLESNGFMELNSSNNGIVNSNVFSLPQNDTVNLNTINSSRNDMINSNELNLPQTYTNYSNTLNLEKNDTINLNVSNLPNNVTIDSNTSNVSMNNTIDSNGPSIVRIKSPSRKLNKLSANTFRMSVYSTKTASNNFEHWGVLFTFLNTIRSEVSIDFTLKQERKKIDIILACHPRYGNNFVDLINQFTSRSDLEKTWMYLILERDSLKISNLLSSKINEMNKVNECPLQLHEQIKQLSIDLHYEKDKFENDLRNSLLANRLYHCQQKLLMVLYREGFIDKSYKKLLDILHAIKNSKYIPSNNQKNTGSNKISYKLFFDLLYHYNNVFVPYAPKNLVNLLKKYKQYLETAEKFRNNRLMSAPQQSSSNISNQPNKIISESNNEAAISNNSSIPLPPSQTPSSSIRDLITIPITNAPNTGLITNTSSHRLINKKIKPTNKQKAPINKQNKPINKQNKLNKIKKKDQYLREATLLVDKATKLNVPQFQGLINELLKKMRKKSVGRKSLRHLRTAVAQYKCNARRNIVQTFH